MIDFSRVHAVLAPVLALSVCAPILARAADMPPPPSLDVVDEERVTFGTGWYLRGDIAAASDTRTAIGNVALQRTNESFNAYSIGVGAGYKYNDWFRTDVTLDWRKPQTALGFTTTNLHVLLNGYLDLGTWYGLTPYVGVGVGFNSRWEKFGDSAYGSTFANTFTGGAFGLSGNGTTYSKRISFAYAAMAGVAYAVTPHLSVDLGYRFLNLGRATAFNATNGARDKNIISNEVRLGLRYTPD